MALPVAVDDGGERGGKKSERLDGIQCAGFH